MKKIVLTIAAVAALATAVAPAEAHGLRIHHRGAGLAVAAAAAVAAGVAADAVYGAPYYGPVYGAPVVYGYGYRPYWAY